MEDDPELENIKQKRLQQLQSNQNAAAVQEQQRLIKEQILSQILTPAARTRLNNISLVKPDRAEKIENAIIMQYQAGLRGQVKEDQIINLLSQVSDQSQKTKIEIQRKVYNDDDDDFGKEKDDSKDSSDDW